MVEEISYNSSCPSSLTREFFFFHLSYMFYLIAFTMRAMCDLSVGEGFIV